jgi:DHA1 family multidrug resistance protein-like MFS transporter
VRLPPQNQNEQRPPDKTVTESPRGAQLFLSLHLPAIALGFGMGVAIPVLPAFAKSFDVSPGLASLVFFANMAGGFIASLPIGYLLDRFGRRNILLAGPIITGVSAILMATSHSFEELLLWRFVGGWGQQMWTISRLTVVADSGSTASRGRIITSMFGIQQVGTLAGPLVGGLSAATLGLQAPFVIQGIVSISAVIPTFFVYRESAPQLVSPRATSENVSTDDFTWRSLLSRQIMILFTAQFFGMTARGGAIGGGTVFVYAVYAYGTDPAVLGILSSIMAAVGIPLTLAAGYLMDRFGRKFTLVPGSGLLGLVLIYLALTSVSSLPFLGFVIGFVMLQIFNSLLSGSWQVIGADLAPMGARGRFFAAGRMVSQGGFSANPLVFSLMTSLSGFTLAFTVLGTLSIISSLMVGGLIKETHRV